MFHIRTKAYYFEQALTVGGAKYRSTGRSFVLAHLPFLQLFCFFQSSHLDYGLNLVLNLVVYRMFIVDPTDYAGVAWGTIMFALVLLYTPFVFNCSAFSHEKVEADVESWRKFIGRSDLKRTKNDKVEEQSWRAHFDFTNAGYDNLSTAQRISFIARNLIWLIIPIAILLEKNASSMQTGMWRTVGEVVGITLLIAPVALGLVVAITLLVGRTHGSLHGIGLFKRCCRTVTRSLCARWLLKSHRRTRFLGLAATFVAVMMLLSLLFSYDDPTSICAIFGSTFVYLLAFVSLPTKPAHTTWGFCGPSN